MLLEVLLIKKRVVRIVGSLRIDVINTLKIFIFISVNMFDERCSVGGFQCVPDVFG